MNPETPRHERHDAPFEIADAEPDDLVAIAHLHRATFDATYPNFPKLHTPEEDLEHFKKMQEHNRLVVAKHDGRVVGYCAFRTGWINDLYVDPTMHGRGIGTALLNSVKEANSELQLWTFQDNENARRFYENQGFVAVEMTDGEGNEEQQPDIRYLWKRS